MVGMRSGSSAGSDAILRTCHCRRLPEVNRKFAEKTPAVVTVKQTICSLLEKSMAKGRVIEQ